MTADPRMKAQDYKSEIKPIWCPGCGDYHVLLAFTRRLRRARARAGGDRGGVGHRVLLADSGLYELLRIPWPDLTVVVATGDGDGYSIGGNHFLHACRRNIDMTYVVMDNHIYGMTKGQPSPTTEPDFDTALSPGGTGLRPFHPLVIALASGANFIARCFAGHPNETANIIVEAIRHPGFSFVEVLSPCVTFRPGQREWKNLGSTLPGGRSRMSRVLAIEGRSAKGRIDFREANAQAPACAACVARQLQPASAARKMYFGT